MTSEGHLIRAKVHAGASKERFTKKSTAAFEISVKEPAKDNRANTHVRRLIARHFRVPIVRVRIVTGHHASSKILRVHA